MDNLDLEKADHDQGVKAQMQLNQIRFTLANMQIGMPLVWLYVWDTICSYFDEYGHGEDDALITRPGLELDEVWNELWTNHPGFSLLHGSEILEEEILGWMIDLGYLVYEDYLDTDDEEESEPVRWVTEEEV
ncbi:hypothetical protein UFOVP1491_31 [uncultured Caudovirales phage]|uniref:Uncharacterized protein n=1 Tax=uncultured Caudovirales phage TaxID=2100421 RepID=A0A6J5N0R8_9CAUD|nr:hypothetical protein UFOVP485_90 [uncultured Caudovirales phage]CAB4150876.1 hypothetical protein UFOVP575_42 [uncultured Caudovirales phage]CAB4175106.1 hypothetical protein UFOVP963_118 [uncultured Caudovirales phage]CAB4179640.1 hypothetical protein UFOVP1032_31 [uncultured Caudovirales phage]CAB4185742.1 hypothetical protein UFOVP1125_99 [uncultured Caudovirales phage]